MKKTKKLTASLLALAMVLSMAACSPTGSEESETPSSAQPEASDQVLPSAELEELGSGDVKWSEEETADGWMLVTNEGGDTLGYSKNSGVTLLQSDGYAFKDLNRNGALDPYEDWRLDNETRARDLANQMSGEEIAPYLTHGGWGTFTTDRTSFRSEDNAGYAYIVGGGRGGVTRNTGTTTESAVEHAKWSNLVQELCEEMDYGIPGMISIDPNDQSGLIQSLSLAATMDPEYAVEVGKAYSEQYRAMGVSALLGPQIDLMTTPLMERGFETYGEDPALSRDITEGFVSGMQSTWDGDTDLGWGSDSVMTIMKHYSGAGASEGGRDDHNAGGKYAIFPNNNYEAHLIAFHDGAFNLTHSSTGSAGGVMMNYSVAYSEDGSLGEKVGGAFSQWKYDTLFNSGWTGFIISDWGPITGGGGSWGMEDYTNAERAMIAIKMGMTQIGGFSDLDTMVEAWELLVDDMGEEEALALMRDRAYENILVSMRLEQFENPYCSTEHVRETCMTDEARAFGLETEANSIVMLKNTGGVIAAAGSEKKTVYIPYTYTPAYSMQVGPAMQDYPATCEPCVDLEIASKYFNVVTDTLGTPSGEGGSYAESDIIRASAADIAACDMILLYMIAPQVDSVAVYADEEETQLLYYTAPSIQYEPYVATTAKETSVSGDKIVETFNDGYTQQTRETKENRSYKGQAANDLLPSVAATYETFKYVKGLSVDTPLVILMQQGIERQGGGTGAMVWSEVEPYADAILNGFVYVKDEAFLMIASGQMEPNGLLPVQQPASMEAVEAQAGEDLPRDVECYVDADGNTYDFTFGLNWAGKIDDERVKTYSAAPLTECTSFDFKYATE